MKKLLAILLCGLLAAGTFAGCQESTQAPVESEEEVVVDEDEDDDIGEPPVEIPTYDENTIVVGLDDQFPPMGFRDEDNELTGFDIELALAVGEKLGMEIVLQPINWSAKEMELDNGNVSLLWNGFTITDARKEAMLVSPAYLNNAQVILVQADSGIQAKADLEGKSVALQTGSSAEEAFNNDADLPGLIDGEPVQMDDNVAALNDLEIGRVDAVVLDKVVAEYYMTLKDGVYRMLAEELAPEEYGIAFRKGDTELHDKVCGALAELIEDGTAVAISEKWFGENMLVFEFTAEAADESPTLDDEDVEADVNDNPTTEDAEVDVEIEVVDEDVEEAA